jgi:hypothetical protein
MQERFIAKGIFFISHMHTANLDRMFKRMKTESYLRSLPLAPLAFIPIWTIRVHPIMRKGLNNDLRK